MVISWFIRNRYLVIQMTKIYISHTFGLHLQFLAHSSPNLWNFLSYKSNGMIIWSLVFSSWKCFGEGDFWIPPKSRGWLPGKPTMKSEGWNFRYHPPSQWRGEGLEVEWIAGGQWFNQSRLCNEASIKTPKERVWRASGLVNTWRFGESGVFGETLSSYLTLRISSSSHWFISFYDKSGE